MAIVEVDRENFENEVLKSKTKVLVDFNADWCGPCRMIRPILEKIAADEAVKIVSVNIDNEEKLAEEYNISSIPCLVLFSDGVEMNRKVGLVSRGEIKNMIGEK